MTDRIFSLAALTVLELSPPDMVEVAARAGYSHVGLRLAPATAEEHHFPLVADAELRRQTQARLRDTGVRVLDLEILRLKPETRVADFEPILAVGAEFGGTELLVAGNDADEARMTERFAELCELAEGYGIHPHLEFMPWTAVPDLTAALEIVTAAGAVNGGVLVDALHELHYRVVMSFTPAPRVTAENLPGSSKTIDFIDEQQNRPPRRGAFKDLADVSFSSPDPHVLQ